VNASKRSRSSEHSRAAVDFDSFPSPAWSHSDSTSRIDKPRTNAPITIALSGSVRSSFVPRGDQFGNERLGRLPHLRDLDRELPLGRLQPGRPKAVAQPRRRLRPPLIPGAAQPRVELILDRPLDDQTRAQLRKLRQRHAA
jgi:hypothetical protein